MLLRSHHNFTGAPVDIWIDPLVAAGCDAYLGCLSALPATVQNFAQHQPLFWDERILPRVRRLGAASRYDLPDSAPEGTADSDSAVFIVHPATHPSRYCQEDGSDWTVFAPDIADISLWQSQLDTRYYQFDWLGELQGLLEPRSPAVEHYMLTNHCDGSGTTQLIHNLRPQHIIFVHGAPQQLSDLASLDDLQARYQLHLPTPAQTIELPLASEFWQPAPPGNQLYEGEVDANPGGIQLRLPASLESDPRWVQLADTGIVEASWQGDQLVIRGLSQRELMQAAPPKRLDLASGDVAKGEVLGPPSTCYYCRHLRGQRCRNADSPLVGLQVTSDGSCAVFERSGQTLT